MAGRTGTSFLQKDNRSWALVCMSDTTKCLDMIPVANRFLFIVEFYFDEF